jgi:hypothetical protein
LYGVWGVIAALLLKWNFPSNIPVISGNLPFGIAGIVSIIAGYLLIQMKEIGRKLAYLVCWANLASITMTTTSFSNGGSTLEVRSLTFHVTSSWPSLGILIASTLFVFVVLHILLIVLFSSRIIKELFSS